VYTKSRCGFEGQCLTTVATQFCTSVVADGGGALFIHFSSNNFQPLPKAKVTLARKKELSQSISSVCVFVFKLKAKDNSPVLTSLKETLFCVLRASFKLGCTRSLSTPPLDEAILVVVAVALVLNPRHANTLLFGFEGSANEKKGAIFSGKSEKVECQVYMKRSSTYSKHIFSRVQRETHSTAS
jgi:hypothetical protein